MQHTQNLQKINHHLFRPVEGRDASITYVILDAAIDESIYKKIKDEGHQDGCLYYGTKGQELAHVAPYLIHLKRGDAFTEWVLNAGWGNSWGIFLESPATPEQLKRHFRRFLMVYDENATPFYFRFYDPRIFQVYLPTCNVKELKTVFGPVKAYFLESEDGNLIEFKCAKDFKLTQNVINLQG